MITSNQNIVTNFIKENENNLKRIREKEEELQLYRNEIKNQIWLLQSHESQLLIIEPAITKRILVLQNIKQEMSKLSKESCDITLKFYDLLSPEDQKYMFSCLTELANKQKQNIIK